MSSETKDGPWKAVDLEDRYDICDPEHRFTTERSLQYSKQWFQTREEAEALAAEMNKAERIRDHAEELLSVVEELVTHFGEWEMPIGIFGRAKSAIRAARGEA